VTEKKDINAKVQISNNETVKCDRKNADTKYKKMAKNKVEEKNKKIDTKVQKVTNMTAKNNNVTENINIKIVAKIGRNKTDNYKSTSKITIERHMKLREKVKCNNVESGNSDKNSLKETENI